MAAKRGAGWHGDRKRWRRCTAPPLLLLALLLLAVGCSRRSPLQPSWSMPVVGGQAAPERAGGSAGVMPEPGGGPRHAYMAAGPGAGVDRGDLDEAPEQDAGGEGQRGFAGDLPETGSWGAPGRWYVDEAFVLRRARTSGRAVVIDVWAAWCEDCQMLTRSALDDPEVLELLQTHFVPLRIDVSEETFANREQLRRYGVVRVPTILIHDADGRELDRIESAVDSATMRDRLSAAVNR